MSDDEIINSNRGDEVALVLGNDYTVFGIQELAFARDDNISFRR